MANTPLVSNDRRRKPPSQIRIDGDSAFVTLTRGCEAAIDIADIAVIAPYRWFTAINHGYGKKYAVRVDGATKRQILMHRQLLNPPKELHVDHSDGDGLNNRRANIRACTHAQNQANKYMQRSNMLGFKGVRKEGNMYHCSIKPNGKTIHLGSFKTPEEASAAYFGAARVLWGDFARK